MDEKILIVITTFRSDNDRDLRRECLGPYDRQTAPAKLEGLFALCRKEGMKSLKGFKAIRRGVCLHKPGTRLCVEIRVDSFVPSH
ncbi:MAG: hypothetical protein QY323_00260 [Patescibacteria group bacterium]|nr:MAG: hypothetical protein QY323_00260 [Patescibacteria group bacterium]